MQSITLFIISLFLGQSFLLNTPTKVIESVKESIALPENKSEISAVHWIDISILDRMMAMKPKKVMIVIYSPQCGWCKTMDKMAFSHPDVIKQINEDFYAVKWRGNSNDAVTFQGQTFEKPIPDYSQTHPFTAHLIESATTPQVGYPAVVFLNEHLGKIEAHLGYKDASQLDVLCRYYGENHYQTMQLNTYYQHYPSSIPADVYSIHINSSQ